MFETTVDRTWNLGNRFLHAANRPLHVSVLALDIDRSIEALRMDWAGGRIESSLGQYYGPAKIIELVNSIHPDDPQVVLTPVKRYPYSTKYKGGVRRMVNNHFLLTSCSGWGQEGDLLIALALNYSMTKEVRLHHVGFRHETYDEMKLSVSNNAAYYNTKPIYVSAEDHERAYIPVPDVHLPNKKYWVEHQWFPDGPHTKGIHWDFATSSNMLLFIQQHLGFPAEFWDSDRKSPFGMISVPDSDGYEKTIMERDTWSDPADW
ncbi:MAG: hypothetical protein QG639_439 [Patescibacteria group bacterium]|nr:hypothetical protein [Patescibacteria group bacterium]